MNKTQDEQATEFIKEFLTEQQFLFGQAVSVCSVIIEIGLIRATEEDVVNGLYQRFSGTLEKDHLQEVVKQAIEYGSISGLFESVDEETIALTEMGTFIGKDWLHRLDYENVSN